MFNFKRNIAHIPGWLTKNEGSFLYDTAKKCSKKYGIVEIGSWKGRSTVCLGLGVKDGNGGKVYAVDPHKDTTEHKKWSGKADTYDTYRIFLANIKKAGIDKYIVPIKNTSEKAAATFEKPIAFIFIDGSHHFSHVKLDYELWFPKLMVSGTVAFHDAWHSLGVMAITTLMLLTSAKIRNPKLIDTLIVFQKVNKNSPIDRVVNFLFVFYRLLFGWIGSVRMHVLGGTNETSTLDKRGILWLKHIYRRIRTRYIIAGVGFATFFFGFGAAALLNIYLLMVRSPLVLNFRSSLNFVSSIVGDGIVLPIVNMLIAAFVIKNLALVNKINVILGLVFGLLITLYFYITQAVKGLVNWSMPTPWHWNFLGVWHFFYMLAVASLISFYVLILAKKIKKEKSFPASSLAVIGGVVLFLILLKLDYSNVPVLR